MLAFGVPFLLVDLADLQRDLYFALYVASVFMFVGLWARQTQQRSLESCWCSRVLGEPSTPHPHGLTFVGAILWRGIVYGAADGVLLSVFPILAVFGLFASTERADAGDAEHARHPDRALPRT